MRGGGPLDETALANMLAQLKAGTGSWLPDDVWMHELQRRASADWVGGKWVYVPPVLITPGLGLDEARPA